MTTRQKWIALIIACLLLLLISCDCPKAETVHGTVQRHDIASDRYGQPTYIIIVQGDNGRIYDLTGLQNYGFKDGQAIVFESYR